MTIAARSYMTTSADSLKTGHAAATHICEGLECPPKLVLTYLTVNHDQASYLRGVRDVVGAGVPVIGCSAQGVIGAGRVREEGYAAGAMALGGDAISVAHAMVADIPRDTREKGSSLARQLREQLSEAPQVVVLHYDALSGVNIEVFLDAFHHELNSAVIGGAAAHAFFYEKLQRTYQYYDDLVTGGAAVACALSGQFTFEVGACHGCAPVGVEFTVTRAEDNVLLELNGRRAIDVWYEICGPEFRESTALAVGLPADGTAGGREYLVRAAYAVNKETGGVVLGSTVPVGRRIMLHHRSTEDVLDGTRRMGQELRDRLQGRNVRAALGFECGSRTRPFLGDEATLQENLELQRTIGADPAWLGMMPWGEIYPLAGHPTFHNYSYPLLVLAD